VFDANVKSHGASVGTPMFSLDANGAYKGTSARRCRRRSWASPHFGILYEDIVEAVRAQFPATVQFILDRVVDVPAGPHRQRVIFANGHCIVADLVSSRRA
jgi:hypothetical protein